MTLVRATQQFPPGIPKLTKVLLITLGLGVSHAHASQWIKVTTSHFKIYSTYSVKSTNRFATILERARPYVASAIGTAAMPTVQTIVTVKQQSDYERLSGNSITIGDYVPGGVDGGYLIFTALDLEKRETLIHELARSALITLYPQMPWCMAQGMAEVISTTRWSKLSVKYGGENIVHATDMWVEEEFSVSVNDLLKIDEATLATINNATLRIVLGESWGLAHMLMLSDKYSERFPMVLQEVQRGTPVADAITKVYREPIRVLEEDFRKHTNSKRFNTARVRVTPQEPMAHWRVELLSPADADTLESEVLVARMNKELPPIAPRVSSQVTARVGRDHQLMSLATYNVSSEAGRNAKQ